MNQSQQICAGYLEFLKLSLEALWNSHPIII
jgi:hypothetical protein